METLKLETTDLKDFKSFIFLKDYLNQFEFCIYKRRTMQGNFKNVDISKIEWESDASYLLRFESYFRNCCSISFCDNMLFIGEYSLRLKK